MDCKNTMLALAPWNCQASFSPLLALALLLPATPSLAATETSEDVTQESGDAQWIWSPAHAKGEVPVGDCFFRKSFDLKKPAIGEIQITADNRFELFVNGQPIGRGQDWRQLQVYDISAPLRVGPQQAWP